MGIMGDKMGEMVGESSCSSHTTVIKDMLGGEGIVFMTRPLERRLGRVMGLFDKGRYDVFMKQRTWRLIDRSPRDEERLGPQFVAVKGFYRRSWLLPGARCYDPFRMGIL